MVKILGWIYGIAFLLAGLAGFTSLAADGTLFGLEVNAAHNVVHILTGLIAIVCVLMGVGAARAFFKVFGIIYLVVALLGFVYGASPILGIIANSMSDAVFHLVIAIIALIAGFSGGRRMSQA